VPFILAAKKVPVVIVITAVTGTLSAIQSRRELIQMGNVQQQLVTPATATDLVPAVFIPAAKKGLVPPANTVTTGIRLVTQWQMAVRILPDLIYVIAFVWLAMVLAVVLELMQELIRAMIVRLLTAVLETVMALELVPFIRLEKKELVVTAITVTIAILPVTQLLPGLTQITSVQQPTVTPETVMALELVASIQVVKKALAVPAITAMMPILIVI